MRFVLRDRLRTFELGNTADAGAEAQYPRARGAASFLRRFAGNQLEMVQLRRLALEHGLSSDVTRLDDATVIKLVAQSLTHARLRVLRAPVHLSPASAVAPPPAAVAPAPRAAPTSSASPAPSEPSTFPSNFDAAAQADALTNAAESGAPFCEECERQRKARAAA